MTHRVTLLAVVLVSLCALAGAAALPLGTATVPAAAPAAAVAPPTPAWLQPAPNSSVEKPGAKVPGEAPLGAVFQNACSQGCNSDKVACVNGCAGDHDCIVNCNNDYLCCLRFCVPGEPLCD